jgi:hypothetical protein
MEDRTAGGELRVENSGQEQIFTCEPGFLDAPELAKDLFQVLLSGLLFGNGRRVHDN